MPVTAKLQRFIDDELSRAPAMAEQTVVLTLAQLQQPRDGMLSQTERAHCHALLQALPKHKPAFVHTFSEALRTLVLEDIRGEGPVTTPAVKPRGLELMDETRIEVDIDISGAAQLITGSAEWELRELQTFTSTLAGHAHVIAQTNPLQPVLYARALWEAACAVTSDTAERALLLRTTAAVISGQLKMAWAAASSRLEAQGVEPSMYRTVVLAPGAVIGREPVRDVTRPGALQSLLSSMPATAATKEEPALGAQAAVAPSPVSEDAMARLDALLQRESGAAPPAEHRASPLAGTSQPADRQSIELLSRLFESVLADARLPSAFRAVMARLQASALRVALADPGMLSRHDHPVWQMMNRIGSVAQTCSDAADPRSGATASFCEALVEEMARAPAPDGSLYTQSLARLDAYLAEQLREQQAQAQPAIEALTRMEQRDVLQQRVAQLLAEQMAPIRTSAGVRRFITSGWAKVLAHVMQHHGEKAEPTLAYLKATDDLLWSLRLPDHPQSRKRLVALLPGLLQRLRDGMTLIGVRQDEQKSALDELMAVHAEALRPGRNAALEENLTPEQLVEQMRNETAWEVHSRPSFSDSLIDLGSMDTVPAEALGGPAPLKEDAADRVAALRAGEWQQLFLGGRWTRVQLLWRSGGYFLFSGAGSEPRQSVSRRALERLAEEGLMAPLDDVSLVQRAVDNLALKLTRSA